MDEVRCPMCGKPNPADLEVCQFCQARLKPLIISPSPEEMPGETPPQKRPSEAEPSKPDFIQPDWLQSLRQGDVTQGLTGRDEEEELPDWAAEEGEPAGARAWYSGKGEDLQEMIEPESGAGEEEGGTETEETPPRYEEAEATDWLDSLRPRSHVEREHPEAEPPPDWLPPAQEQPAEEEVPDWLHRIRERQKTEEPQTPPAVPDEEAAKFMAELREKPTTEEKSPTEPLSPTQIQHRLDEELEMPDWLADMADTSGQGELPELPEWLEPEEPEQEEVPFEPVIEAKKRPTAELPLIPEEGEETPPEWLSSLEKKSSLGEVELTPASEEEEAKPDWLKELETGAPPAEQKAVKTPDELMVVAPFTIDEETVEAIEGEEPDWLKEVTSQEAQLEAGERIKGDEELAPAELPTWLEAMRPVEAVAPSIPILDEHERAIESSGPLAGLRGILPAEPEVARQKKPPTYSVKLSVSEGQQANAALLAEMVKSEGIAKPLPRPAVITQQMVQRLVIFLLLLAAVAWPVFSGDMGTPVPEIAPEILDSRNIASGIPDGGNVLLAVDYQPGFSGEMESAAASLLDNLMIKGAYLTMISTSTNGPAQAERLLARINDQMGHHYQDINQYANLGYIAGGTSGLRGFAESPRGILPFALNDDPELEGVWADGRLATVQKLTDFALLVVITENPDTARAWIEQVGPLMGDVPMLMVVSAQADPMVRPYYEGSPQQVQGLISGLSGGMAYASIMRPTGLAQTFWDAFSFGIPIAVLIILLGGLASVILAYLPGKPRTKGEVA